MLVIMLMIDDIDNNDNNEDNDNNGNCDDLTTLYF